MRHEVPCHHNPERGGAEPARARDGHGDMNRREPVASRTPRTRSLA
jgi:hypothetical protein